jgi:hypothetical protein
MSGSASSSPAAAVEETKLAADQDSLCYESDSPVRSSTNTITTTQIRSLDFLVKRHASNIFYRYPPGKIAELFAGVM